jgi:ribonuclease-3 family protein
MFEALLEGCIFEFDMKPTDVLNLQPLVLAYVGDAVYEAYIRTMLVATKKANVHNLHKMSVKYVKAKAQADILHRLNDQLTAEEQDVVRRGRNAKSASVPKNAEVSDYRYSTGFEALIGYLYLMKNMPRLLELLKLCVVPEENT